MFVVGKHSLMVLVLALLYVPGTVVHAQNKDASLSFTPNYLKVDGKRDERDELQEARFKTGLGLKLRSDLMQVSFDYKVQVDLKDETDDAKLAQQVGAKFYSDKLNRALGVKADVTAGSTIRQVGDAYAYSITPGLTKSFSDLATLSLQYQYLLDQANAKAVGKERTGYRMGLSGKARDGRLTWRGNYGSTDVFGGVRQLQNIELLEFVSRYQMNPGLRFEFSGRSKHQTNFSQGLPQEFLNETRYAAGLAWTPSQYYSVALKVNRRNESRADDEHIFGSGILSWFPNDDLEFTFSYGDHPIGGSRAIMLGTRIDLSGS